MASLPIAEQASRLLQSINFTVALDSQGFAREMRLLCRDAKVLQQLAPFLTKTDSVAEDERSAKAFPYTDRHVTTGHVQDSALSTIDMALAQLENDYGTHYWDVPYDMTIIMS